MPADDERRLHRAVLAGDEHAWRALYDAAFAGLDAYVLWRCAGLIREPAQLERLAADDPFPLARAIARAALARTESRGAHQRVDHPETDPALDGMHSVVTGEERAYFRRWT